MVGGSRERRHDRVEQRRRGFGDGFEHFAVERAQTLRDLPQSQRKARLDAALAKLPSQGPIRLADQIHSDSAKLIANVCNQHLEGLIAKKTDAPYVGSRSTNWLKIKCHREQEFVVGGAAFLPGRGTGTFSSLLVGVKSGKGLRYAGRVGGGFNAAERAASTMA